MGRFLMTVYEFCSVCIVLIFNQVDEVYKNNF